jgi:hypothetical protein
MIYNTMVHLGIFRGHKIYEKCNERATSTLIEIKSRSNDNVFLLLYLS